MIRRPLSLRGLTIAFIALFLAVTLLVGLGTFFATLAMIDDLVDHRIQSESIALAPAGIPVDRAQLAQRIVQLTNQRETGDLGLLLTDRTGRRIAGNSSFSRTLPTGLSTLTRQDGIQGLTAGRVLVRDIGGGLRLTVFAETEPIDHYLVGRRRIYIAGFGAIIIVVLTGLLLFRRLIGQRIEQMRLTAQSIVEGDLSRRVPIAGDGGEFDRQAAAFNHMLDRMNLLMAEIRNVSNDIAHELRTPLARLRNELSLLEQRQEARPVCDRLRLATAQADDLLAMFGAMLRIAEIESGSRRAGFTTVDLRALVDEIAEIVQPVIEDHRQHLVITPFGGVTVQGDRQLLSQLLLNLVENAARHTPEGTEIRISVERGDDCRIMVTDNGPGIAPPQRPLVMRRFGRLDRSEGRSGHGLGLPLADAIARLHHGAMMLDDAAPGLRVVLILPL